MKRRTVLIRLAGLMLLAAVAYVAWQAGITLMRLEQVERASHTLSPATAEAEITAAGFTRLHRDDTFIDRPGDQPWWLMVFTKR